MPISTSSWIVHPCKTTEWPTVTRSPTVVNDRPSVQWITELSWIELRAPIRIGPSSPRRVTLGHTLDSGPITTSPISTAEGWT